MRPTIRLVLGLSLALGAASPQSPAQSLRDVFEQTLQRVLTLPLPRALDPFTTLAQNADTVAIASLEIFAGQRHKEILLQQLRTNDPHVEAGNHEERHPPPPRPENAMIRNTPLLLALLASPSAAIATDYPEFLRPGTRISWYQGSATIRGARTHLVQDDKGRWVDPQSGRRYSNEETAGSAGAGYTQYTILAADAQGVVAEGRAFLLQGDGSGRVSSTQYDVQIGTPDAMSDYWIHPAKLAATESTDTPQYKVFRGDWPQDGRNYQAITIKTIGASGYFSSTYDLESGLLISASSSVQGSSVPVLTPGGDGTIGAGAGATSITATRLVSVRSVDLPWTGSTYTGGLRRDASLAFEGVQRMLVPGVPETPPTTFRSTMHVQDASRGFVDATFRQVFQSPGAPPTRGEQRRVLGAMTCPGMFIPTDALAELDPNQVIDRDPVTHFAVTYLGVEDGRAVFVERGPMETNHYAYDLRSGVLTGFALQQTNGVGTTITQGEARPR